jgi:hypothetical protein
MIVTVMTRGLAGLLSRSAGLDVGSGRVWSSAWRGEPPLPRYVNLFTTCVLYLAMARPSRLHPARTGALAGRDRHRQRQAGQSPMRHSTTSSASSRPVRSRSSVAAYQHHRLEEPPPRERLLLSRSCGQGSGHRPLPWPRGSCPLATRTTPATLGIQARRSPSWSSTSPWTGPHRPPGRSPAPDAWRSPAGRPAAARRTRTGCR